MNQIRILIIASFVLASCTGSDHVKKFNQKEKTMALDSTKQCFSFGWINRELIASGKILPHINAYGGEERLWLGPEGGQYSIFFSKGKSFIFEEWQTPAFLDTTPYELISATDSSTLFASDIVTENYSGTLFKLRLEREVTLLSEKEIIKQTIIDVKGLNYVAYRSGNTIINKGDIAWSKETGLLSIWMPGMFNPSPSVVVVIPVKPGESLSHIQFTLHLTGDLKELDKVSHKVLVVSLEEISSAF